MAEEQSLEELTQLVKRQSVLIQEQGARLQALEQGAPGPPQDYTAECKPRKIRRALLPSGGTENGSPSAVTGISRADLMKSVAVGVAVMSGAQALRAKQADAADGQPLLVGRENRSATTTEVIIAPSKKYVNSFLITDTIDFSYSEAGLLFAFTTGDDVYGNGNAYSTAIYGEGQKHASGVIGTSQSGDGVAGVSESGHGVFGTSSKFEAITGKIRFPSNGSAAIHGATEGAGPGVYGESKGGAGVFGAGNGRAGSQPTGVWGDLNAQGYAGVLGRTTDDTGTGRGVYGQV